MNKYQDVLERGYQFDMSLYMGEGWKLFKQGAGSFIGFTVLYFVITFIFQMIPLVSLFSAFISYPLIAGIFIFCRNLGTRREEFGDLFNGFKYFQQIALYLIILLLFFTPIIILVFTVLIPFDLIYDFYTGGYDPQYIIEDIVANIEDNLASILGLYLVIMAGALYITISYSFALPLIVDDKMGFWDAMETSRKVIGKRFFSFLGMFIVLGLLLGIGTTLTCFTGILVAFPYFYCVIFATYDNILNPQSDNLKSQLDSFGEQSEDINTEGRDV